MKRAQARAETHRIVLESARRFFERFGFEGTHIREIAKDIGRSTGSVFLCFPTKEALFEAAMGYPAPNVKAFLMGVRDGTDDESVFRATSAFLASLYGRDVPGP